MNRWIFRVLIGTIFFLAAAGFSNTATQAATPTGFIKKDISVQQELSRTFNNAFDFLKKNQNPDGSWSNPDFPALTGLVLTAFLRSPAYADLPERPEFISKGLTFLLANVHENGAIYKEALPNYNTAVSIMALLATRDPQYYPVIIKARNFLASLQSDKGATGVADIPTDGGVGYGTKDFPDLSNTYMALEAIKMSEFLESDQYIGLYNDLKNIEKKSLNWEAALKFIERCQNLPGYNDQEWASGDSSNKGGFVYYPGNSKAGEESLADGKTALRSYGSMTYAGLLSYIFADLKKDDPRVTAAHEWLSRNFTLDENPGAEQQGLYYYYHTMAKALNAYGSSYLTTPDGRSIDWRQELTLNLINRQKPDGSWVNDAGRWWENDPVLVTSYALIALNLANFGK